MRILQLKAENVKRLTVVQITPDGNLVQITGGNGNGKTSVLDAIWMALGGKDAMPEQPLRKGAKAGKIELTIGDADGPQMIVERRLVEGPKDKQPQIVVRGTDGTRYNKPQDMLDKLTGAISFDPLSFMRMKDKDQAVVLRGLVKFDVDMDVLDRRRTTTFEDRTVVNRQLTSAKARAEAITVPDGLPDEPPNVGDLTAKLADAAKHNTRVAQRQQMLRESREELAASDADLERLLQHVEAHKTAIAAARAEFEDLERQPIPEEVNTDDLYAQINAANQTLDGFRKQTAKIAALAEVSALERDAEAKTDAIAEIDKTKADAMAKAKMPIEGLTFEAGTVLFNGLPLSQASGAEQLRVSAAIGAALNPKLRVMLARDGSLLDGKSMAALAEFAEAQNMQIWLEVVDDSGAVGIVMEDGHVKGQEALVEAQAQVAAGETVAPPDGDADQAARKYLDSMLGALPTAKLEDLDKYDAQVKVKLSRFPQLIATDWNPAKLRRLQELGKKK